MSSESHFRRAIDSHVKMQLSFFSADFGDVDVEVADGVDFEGSLCGFVPLNLRQST